MKIPVLGMDPSLRNWGLAFSELDLDSGLLDTPRLSLVQTGLEPKGKKVRQNTYDLLAAEHLANEVYAIAKLAQVSFVEVPHGSQSADAMKGYGTCIGVLGSLRSRGIHIIEISESNNKITFTGDREATKKEMIAKAVELYPNANWPMHNRKISAGKAEHMADAVAAIHAGAMSPDFQQFMNLIRI